MKTEMQNEVSHTPGPWRLDGFLVLSSDHNPRTIATVEHDQQGLRRWHERHEANARLIAAAPDLLEACKALLDCDLYFERKQAPAVASKYQAAYEMAREAIAKAVGRAE